MHDLKKLSDLIAKSMGNRNKSQFALNCGLTASAISRIIDMKRKPSPDTLKKIASRAHNGVTYEQLMSAAGYTDVNSEQVTRLIFDNIMPITKQRLPLLGEIACGKPIMANVDRESYVEVGTDIRADFCLKAKGDSMKGARILSGDIVFIRKQDMVAHGEIAAVIIDDECTLKRVYFYPDSHKLVLNAENPAYEPLVYIGEELNHIIILGKAIAFQSDIK